MTRRARRSLVLACAAGLLATTDVWSQSSPAQYPTVAEIETFLRNGTIVRARDADGGTVGARRVTMSHGPLTHDAQVTDTYRYDIAAYRLATLLWVRVPVSIERSFEGKPAAFSWWVDDVAMDEATRVKRETRGNAVRVSRELNVMRVFDALIQNEDRPQTSMLWASDWTLWLTNHVRAFRAGRDLLNVDQLRQIDRGLLERVRALDLPSLERAVGASLDTLELAAVLARRDALVRHFDSLIARVGEEAALFDLDDVDPLTR